MGSHHEAAERGMEAHLRPFGTPGKFHQRMTCEVTPWVLRFTLCYCGASTSSETSLAYALGVVIPQPDIQSFSSLHGLVM